MKNKPLASILITNYNKEKFLKKTINSCLKQNYKNKEIIFFDDNSNDNSLKIMQKYKKVFLIKNKKKKYLSSPLNQINGVVETFKESKGNYLFLLDSDDRFKTNKISNIIKIFEKNKEVKFIQDVPKMNSKNIIKLKRKKHFFSIWPSFYNTSCITAERVFFKEFLKLIQKNKFPNLEIDARLSIYAFLRNKFKILGNSYTFYNYDMYGITSNYNKFSFQWWKKRKEAFEYMFYLMIKLGLNIKKGPDYYITNIINFLIDLFCNQKKLS